MIDYNEIMDGLKNTKRISENTDKLIEDIEEINKLTRKNINIMSDIKKMLEENFIRRN